MTAPAQRSAARLRRPVWRHGPMSRRRTAYVVIGGLLGLTWAAALRGWMVQLAEGESHSTFTWMTLVLVLLPGLAIGMLLGWSAQLRSRDLRGSRWLVFSPLLFASALLDPEIFHALITNGQGGGALIVVAIALCTGYVVSRRRWSVRRSAAAVVAAFGLLMIGGMGGMAAPLSSPRGAWVGLYGFVLVLLFGLASVLPYPRSRPTAGARAWVAFGAVCGLAWACALRSFMAEVAGTESGVEWVNTFGFILLPGTLIGGLLGWAEHLRRTGRRPGRRRLALAPLLFSAILFSNPLNIAGLLDNGVGGGAIGVPLIAMLGGFAVSGSRPDWPRILTGLGFLAGFVTWLVVATDVGGPSFSLTTVHGLWTSTLYESLLVLFALAASVPHRAPVETGKDRDTVTADGAPPLSRQQPGLPNSPSRAQTSRARSSRASSVARAASRRAMGTRKGEQKT